MKFETKYLIRWGIPGWVFVTWFFIVAFGTIDPLTSFLIKGTNLTKIFGFLITLLSIGVPIGYLFHQIYFAWEWNNKRKKFFFLKRKNDILQSIISKIENYTDLNDFHENYYYIEFLWHNSLLKVEQEKRDYIIGRYRYFLSTIHGLGSLMYSLATSFFLLIFFFHSIDGWLEITGLILVLIAHTFLFFGVYHNYKYYSRNLIVFQANFLEEMMKTQTDNNGPNTISTPDPATSDPASPGNGGAGDTTT